jgi:hypothetical protein
VARTKALEAADLIEAQAAGGEREQPRVRQQHAEVHPAEEAPQHAARALALDVGARGLDELAIGHARRAHGLAGAAAEAQVEMRRGGVRERDAALRHRLDQEDAPAGRIHLRAEQGEGRAVGEAEAAVHAAIDPFYVVAVQGERARRGGERLGSVRHALRSLPRTGRG